MQDRRQCSRFLLTRPLDGTLSIMDDVVVERYVDGEIIVLASMAARPAESLLVDHLATDVAARVGVHVVESGPTVVDGRLRHRLRLRLDGRRANGWPRISGSLVRTMPARLIEVSDGGCRVETSMPVENGLSAQLEVTFGDAVMGEGLRICRCQIVPGAGPLFRVGAEFRSTAGSNYSLRHRLMSHADGGTHGAAVRLIRGERPGNT